jgi:hypothetical protein
MPSKQDRLSEEAARAIWRRAAQLQAEAERRVEESHRLAAKPETSLSHTDGLHPDDVRAAGEQAGISPEFVQIALAEASASGGLSSVMTRPDVLGARLFLGASRHTIEATTTIRGNIDVVSDAVLQVFSGHPCLLHTGAVAELPSWSGRVIVFNVPKYDWGATANPPFVEKAAMIGLKQLHVAVRPVLGDEPTSEVVVAGDLHPGMRSRWRWSAATSVGATAAGGAAGVGLAASALAGALLIVPAILGAAVISGASVGAWALGYRYYRGAVEDSLRESLQLLPAATLAIGSSRNAPRPAPGDRARP